MLVLEMSTIASDLKILDGGFSTQLVELGHKYIDDDPLWGSRLLVTDPGSVKKVHLQFLEAGADVIITNTYHINVDILVNHCHMTEDEAVATLVKGVKIAEEARSEFLRYGTSQSRKRPLVAGSVGPYAVYFHDASEYHGNYIDDISFEDLKNWHRPRIAALLKAGVDLLAFETIPAKKEAEALCDLIQEFPDAKAWLSFVIKDKARTTHGELLEDCLSPILTNKQIIGLGVNCCSPIHVEDALKAYQCARESKILIVYSNSGEEWKPDHKWYGKAEAAPLSSFVPEWRSLGARWIGGCCRVYPKDIEDISRAMKICDL